MNYKQNKTNEFFPSTKAALMTDLYELTMAAGYYAHKMNQKATFELFVRNITPRRSYLICAGLAQALHYLENLHFEAEEIRYLREHPAFNNVGEDFWDYLRRFSFSGDIWAAEEGELVFSNEPILQVTAPLIEAQIVETYLLSIVNFQTMIATKASRVVLAARGRAVVDFGTRRAHGPEAGVLAARACYIGGCVGTSNVCAGYTMKIPIYGTIAHSWVMAFDSEEESFNNYCKVFPNKPVLLIDTFDTGIGAEIAAKYGHELGGVRIDSGDLLEESLRVRRILDSHGLKETKIIASSDLNEFIINDLISHGAPIDIFGVGTEMVTSADAPSIGGVYKLVEIEKESVSQPKAKYSPGKRTIPGIKQIFRITENGSYKKDILGLRQEKGKFKNATPILKQVMKNGKPMEEPPSVHSARKKAMEKLKQLPDEYRDFTTSKEFPVEFSKELEQTATIQLKKH